MRSIFGQYINAMKSELFFYFYKLKEKVIKKDVFVKISREKDNKWTFNVILKFMQFLLGRFNYMKIMIEQ